MYDVRLEDIKKHSLAGLFALAGNLEVAVRIASHEGDILHVTELTAGICNRPGRDGLQVIHKKILKNPKITDWVKSLYCLAVSDYGELKVLIDFVKSRPELWDLIIREFDGKEDTDISEFALAVKDTTTARKCLSHLMTCSFPSTSEIQKILNAYPSISLSVKEKECMIRAAIAGDQTPEEVCVCERLAGRKLTDTEQERYLKNRFRERIDWDVTSSLDWVWKHQGRRFTKHERRLLRKDAKETLELRTKIQKS